MGYTSKANVVTPVLAIGRVGALCGNVHRIDPPAWVTDNALILQVDTQTFVYSYLHAMLLSRNLNDLAAKTAQPLITSTQVLDQRLPCPPMSEQVAIADFLDRETAKIDALVEKKKRLIELLLEKRTALITHAVTEGLDPNVPMKDSGIEWLGEIPAHWKLASVKRFAEIVNRATPRSSEPEYWDGNVAWATPDDLGQLRSRVLEDTSRYITKTGYASCGTTLVPPGSLILSTRAPIGHLAIAGRELCINQGCRGLILDEHDSSVYRYYSVLAVRPILQALGEGSTFRELPRDTLVNVVLPNPPQEERNAIADFLDRETAKIDALVGKIEEAIKLLKEYRTALISAAVTGKIDVRNEMT
jgi:type I restriction enzyme S subunit